MRRETQNLLLLLLGGAVLKIALTGTYVRYVKPSLLPWLIAAAAVTVGLALFAIFRDIRAAQRGVADTGDCREHGTRSPWMLLLPVFAIFLVAPPALGADAVTRAGDGSRVPDRPSSAEMFPELPPGDAPLLSVSEFVTRVVWDDSGTLDGRPIRLRGFVVHPEQEGPTQLARLRVNCCAADAAPIRVDLAGAAAKRSSTLAADTWIEVTGTLRTGSATEANGQVPTLEITQLRRIAPPQDPYEY
ncbi:TIGR03943 family protein [Allosaccharopolyspora coralli]|uniref:TIGR03943 family protein n=1 Tax=Allosaccharopolyspora coralli TaxID=2665642 RepID=A0A5Q3Q4B5_9PSEU|nr:TIGR03943 family protein [Allosaccharopolyspora coralli]QGK69292.1 TIGR03943 family protein [Allosaccharopolyspora coralli]